MIYFDICTLALILYLNFQIFEKVSMNIYIYHFPIRWHAWEILELNTMLKRLGMLVKIDTNCLENPIQSF